MNNAAQHQTAAATLCHETRITARELQTVLANIIAAAPRNTQPSIVVNIGNTANGIIGVNYGTVTIAGGDVV